MAGVANGQTQAAGPVGPNGQRLTDPTRLTTEALMREIEIINKDLDRRFGFYDRLLADADKQRLEQKSDTKGAVDAALAAAKEAVKEQTTAAKEAIGKTETIFFSAIEQMKSDITELKAFKDRALGKSATQTVMLGAAFALLTLALRFFPSN